MRVAGRRGRRGTAAAVAAMAAVVLAGCGDSDEKPDKPDGPNGPDKNATKDPSKDAQEHTETTRPDAGKGPWGDGGTAAEAGKTVGDPGSPCSLPVTLSAARGWKAESVPKGTHSQGTVDIACEIDAKPTGNIGYLRVWTGDGGSPRKALEAFTEDGHPRHPRYRTAKTDDGTAVTEVSYTERTVVDGEELDSKPVLALAARAADGKIAVVELGGMDAEEHRQMLPAYLLAKKTLKTRG